MQNRTRMNMYGRRAPGRSPGVTSTAAFDTLSSSSNTAMSNKRRGEKTRKPQQQQQQTLATRLARPAPPQRRRPPSPPSSSSSSSTLLDLPCYVPMKSDDKSDSGFGTASSSNTNAKAHSTCEAGGDVYNINTQKETQQQHQNVSPWSSAPTCINAVASQSSPRATPDLLIGEQQRQSKQSNRSTLNNNSHTSNGNNADGFDGLNGVIHSDAIRSDTATGVEGPSVSDSRSNEKAMYDEIALLQEECARRNVPFTQHHTETIHNTGSNSPRTFYELDPHLLIHILSYCDVASLSYCGRTCVRLYIFCNAPSLWLAQAKAQGVLITSNIVSLQSMEKTTAEIKAALKAERLRQQAAAQVEEDRAKAEYAALERRIAQRASIVQSVSNTHDIGTHHTTTTTTSSLNGISSEVSARRLEQLQQELSRVETLLRDAVAVTLRGNEAALRAQQVELQRLHARLHEEDEGEDEDVGPAPPPRTTTTTITSTSASVPLTYDELCAFERRMTRLVLCGRNLAPATLTPQRTITNKEKSRTQGQAQDGDDVEGSMQGTALPVVLRRGIVSFGEIELLCLQAQDASSSSNSSSSSTTVPGLHAVKERWAAFKRFFPLGEDYYTARHVLRQHHAQSGEQDLSHRVRYIVDRVAAFVRRIQAMKEHEVLDVVM